jgi:hypothetical protein
LVDSVYGEYIFEWNLLSYSMITLLIWRGYIMPYSSSVETTEQHGEVFHLAAMSWCHYE